MTHVLRRVAAAMTARATSTLVRGLLADRPPGGPRRWERTNHRGEAVSLLGGPAVAAGALMGGLVGAPSVRDGLAMTTAVGSATAFGLVDDLAEDRTGDIAKGMRGHLGALRRGELTTGALKVLGIGAGALLAAALTAPRGSRPTGRLARTGLRCGEIAMDGALIAATANVINLLDLRPGRALKAAGIIAAPVVLTAGPGACSAAAVLGAVTSELPADLAESDMLGDSGANALGAALGMVAVQRCPAGARLALLAGAVALTVASERVSFTQVIARTPVLRELDEWGRRPAEAVPSDVGVGSASGTEDQSTTDEVPRS